MTTSRLPVYDLSTPRGSADFEQRLNALRASSSLADSFHATADTLIHATQQEGDQAIVDHMRQWTDPDFTADRMRVTDQELDAAKASLPDELRGAIERAMDQVRAYQEHIKPDDAAPITIGGAELGLRFTPISPVGLLVPGGSAVLFSTLIMLAIPALVAGVKPGDISVVTPPPYRKAGAPAGDVSPITLAVAQMLGIDKVYRIGGPPAVAALAYGTDTVAPVNFIAGPGHPVVQAAKLRLRGIVGTDDYYGTSEIVVLADAKANPKHVASDLIAQAEHDPGKCFLVAWEARVIEAIQVEIAKQLPGRARQDAIAQSLVEASCAVLVSHQDQALAVVDRLACEHVNLAVANPDAMLAQLQHGGEFFLGDTTPVAAGDYYAGPSHTLPTGTTARFSSGVSVYTFLKRSGTVAYRQGMSAQAIDDIARMAQAEGLDGHAASARVRG